MIFLLLLMSAVLVGFHYLGAIGAFIGGSLVVALFLLYLRLPESDR